MRFFLKTQTIGVAALALGLGVLLSRVMGLVRDKIISYAFGAGVEADIYFTAFVVPDFINYLLAGGYFSITLVPLLSSAFEKDRADGWRFFSAAVCWAALAITALTAVAWIFAAPLARAIAPGFAPEATARLAEFLRIILPAQICFLPGACFTALLYLRKQFTIPAITPLVYNGGIILFGVLGIALAPESGMKGFCWGVLFGALCGSLLLPMLAVRAGGLEFAPCLSHPLMKRVLVLALPLMLGQSIVVLDEQFVRIFGSLAGDGSVSLLNYARRIMQVPVGVIAQAAGLASYPFLVSLITEGKMGEFHGKMREAMGSAVLVALPVSLWMMAAAEPIMRLIFQQGNFGSTDAEQSGLLLMIMMAAVVFWTIQQMLGRAFYAFQDMLTPAITGTVVTVATLPLYWAGATWLGAPGVALAGSAGIALYTAALWRRFSGKYGGHSLRGLLGQTGRALAFCLPATLGAWGTAHGVALLASGHNPVFSAFLQTMASGLAFAALYLGLLLPLAPELAAPFVGLWRKVTEKILRRGKAAS